MVDPSHFFKSEELAKLHPRLLGPFKVTGISPETSTYKLELNAVREEQLSPVSHKPQGHQSALEDNQYAVDRILCCKTRAGTNTYLVRWQGYGKEDDSWVEESDINPELVK